jgi:hydrogenase maturation factor
MEQRMNKTILLAQGSGGRLSHELIEKVLVPAIANPLLEQMDDSAVFSVEGRLLSPRTAMWSIPSSSPEAISAGWRYAAR